MGVFDLLFGKNKKESQPSQTIQQREKSIHICLVSDQPIPNITTVLQFKPEIVVLLTSEKMKQKSKYLEDFLKKIGFKVDIFNQLNAYDIEDVMSRIKEIVNKYNGFDISLNMTGGTKISSLGAFLTINDLKYNTYYVDSENNNIILITPERAVKTLDIDIKISVEDYLYLYGFKTKSVSNKEEIEKGIHKREKLSEYLLQKISLVKYINTSLHEYNTVRSNGQFKIVNAKDNKEVPLPIRCKELERIPVDEEFLENLKLLNNTSFDTKTNSLIVGDVDDFTYLKGGWFEEWVYIVAKSLNPDDVRLRVEGEWLTQSYKNPKNEFDVIMTKGNRIYYLSCKTSNADRKESDSDEGIGKRYIFEIDSLSDMAMGEYCKKILVSFRDINDPQIRERARMSRIEIIDYEDIFNLRERLQELMLNR